MQTIGSDDKILLKSGEKYVMTEIEEIVVIKAADDYSEVYLRTGERVMIKRSLKNWEEKLPGKKFLRIHRNTIINIKMIEKIEQMFSGAYIIRLSKFPEPVYSSQRYSQKIRKELLLK